ncbi:conserved membrane hypothetical protein [Burkholderia sp. 8Y]|uniref:hypothetical protein n=1 Tax=Burkholderia sp. 8Y TaxID=2653133 RepID=UPI0012F41663|nr:hypothetical protein [Burkholderia sp. 8Y]VXA95921.1 conserved membrane hypothetical protein [Burkholderia sp. 8Y]
MNMPIEGADAAASSAGPSLSRSGSFIDRLPRALFIVAVLYGAVLFWIAPRPPLADLPQHAGQVMLLHDLLEHASPWTDQLRINLFTPYLIGYGLALPLTYVMAVSAAIKLILTLAYFGFVASCIAFRKDLNGDPRLDILFVPGFFGFAFGWGFYTFLVAAPVGMLFLRLVHRYAAAPSLSKGVVVSVAGTALFFCHGLVFLFACATGVCFVLVKQRRVGSMLCALAPFVPLGLLCIAHAMWSHASDPVLNHGIQNVTAFEWGWTDRVSKRLISLPVFVWSLSKDGARYLPVVALMAAAPWLWRDRINRDRAAIVPMIVVVFIWMLVPSTAAGTAFLYQRFGVFLLPAYALMFVAAEPAHWDARRAMSASALTRVRDVGLQLAMIAGCLVFFTDQSIRLHRFAAENAGLEQLLSQTEPGQRALNLVFDPESAAYGSPAAYMHQALWYQAEERGFVNPNFAIFLPQIVRFRPEHVPPDTEHVVQEPDTFQWKTDGGRAYRYFFVHKAEPLRADFFTNDECDVALVTHSGAWWLYERRNCR